VREVDLSELHAISELRSAAVADLIFVHGLGGDPFSTWWHDADRPKDSWPFWLAEDFPQVAVHCLAYDASPSKWLGSSMPLVDRATNLLTLFEARAIGERPLFFVCHSLGGLVTKQAVRSALDLGERAWREIAKNTRGIVFLATPHTGARLADYLGALGKILRLSVSVSELEASAPALRDLNVWYRQNARDLGIETLAMFETRDTLGVRVVDEASSDAGLGVPRGMDADHFSICKPQGRTALVYGAVVNFLGKRLPPSQPSPAFEPRAQPSATPEPGPVSRYFISYSRRSAEDGKLAGDLRAGLESSGHEVFIDVSMRIGTDWVAEIEHRIDWCDFLVVLLSEASIHSEMVLGEVRMAHRKRRKDGRPHVLPIRVRYEGLLDYELDSYLARIQYARWTEHTDTSRVIEEILTAPRAGAPAAVDRPSQPLREKIDRRRPQPSEDLRPLLSPPGGTIRPNDEFYIQRPADVLIETMAARPGETLAIKAPRQFGKSSLLIRYLAECSSKREASQVPRKCFALVDFQSFTDAELDNYATLLTRIAEELVRGLRLKATPVPRIETQAKLSDFVEDEIFRQVAPPVTLAFDEVDRVLGRSYQSDFFSMLRLWHNRRAEPLSPWERVDLALVIATEPYLLIESADRSPFNVATPVELEPFDRLMLDDLNDRYTGILTSGALDGLHELLAGHPFLTRLGFYRIVTGEVPGFDVLEKRATEPDGPFGDHLRAKLMLLKQKEGLLQAMQQVIKHASCPDDDTYFRLHGAGLVGRNEGRVTPANLLYARFFRTLW
jgi:AAA-like domain/TIR domain